VKPDLVIVGGSLAGLTLALSCAARGVPVRVIERADAHRRGGDSLSIDLAELFEATGHDPRAAPMLPVVHAYRGRSLTTWPALYSWLRDRVINTTGIALQEGRAVTLVADRGDSAELTFADGTQEAVAGVIGADGYRSVVRQAIAPDAPFARYAGYLVWRGLVEEAMLERPVAWPSNGGLWIDFVAGYRLVAAALPGRDGSVELGRRQIAFAWFDAHREQLLRQAGCLSREDHVVGTLGASAIDPDTRADLAALAQRVWPSPWTEAVQAGVRSPSALSGASIAEYRPERLARGALAIVGDAAHSVSPMTGRGFAASVGDASVLAQLLAKRREDEPVANTLARYEAARLPLARSLVATSMRLSAEYVRYAAQQDTLLRGRGPNAANSNR
jgi:2-polyprenyl-6-methoxyphenol hydroxylase-like FAD-dependent oxidoreductase